MNGDEHGLWLAGGCSRFIRHDDVKPSTPGFRVIMLEGDFSVEEFRLCKTTDRFRGCVGQHDFAIHNIGDRKYQIRRLIIGINGRQIFGGDAN